MPSPAKTKPRSNAKDVIIREMSLQDLPAIFALGERLFPADKWPALYRTWDEYELAVHFASDSETCLVAELDDAVVGFALGIDPEISRKGVAARLFGAMTDLFIKLGARMIMVDTDAENEPALSFFRSQGFGQETPHLFLSRNLTHDPDYLRHRRPARPASTRRKTATPSRPNYAPGQEDND